MKQFRIIPTDGGYHLEYKKPFFFGLFATWVVAERRFAHIGGDFSEPIVFLNRYEAKKYAEGMAALLNTDKRGIEYIEVEE